MKPPAQINQAEGPRTESGPAPEGIGARGRVYRLPSCKHRVKKKSLGKFAEEAQSEEAAWLVVTVNKGLVPCQTPVPVDYKQG